MDADDFVDDFIEHYGVPGMKWGHRKSSSELSGVKKHLSNWENSPGFQRRVNKGHPTAEAVGRGVAKITPKQRRASAVKNATDRASQQDRFGNRRTKEAQRRVDHFRAVASGKATFSDKAWVALNTSGAHFVKNNLSLKNVATSKLERDAKAQRSINAGKKRVTDKLNRLMGIDMRELNFNVNA